VSGRCWVLYHRRRFLGLNLSDMTVSLAGQKMSSLLRQQYLAAVIVQDQAFFDRIGPGEIVTRASRDIESVRTGMGERLGYLIFSSSNIIAVRRSLDPTDTRHSSLVSYMRRVSLASSLP
jgi:ABC-type multidrug transport system fused ATPase/permease subunit